MNEFIGYENLTDCLEIWPEDSQDIDKKYRVRDFRFSKLISRNGLRRNTYREIFDKQIGQNNFKATNRNMEKASHGFLD